MDNEDDARRRHPTGRQFDNTPQERSASLPGVLGRLFLAYALIPLIIADCVWDIARYMVDLFNFDNTTLTPVVLIAYNVACIIGGVLIARRWHNQYGRPAAKAARDGWRNV